MLAVGLCAAVAPTAHASGREAVRAELRSDLIHADLPLWNEVSPEAWPRPFFDEESFGCMDRIAYGAWRYEEAGDPDATWFLMDNHGLFHCALMVSDAPDRKDLQARDADFSFLIELGETRGPDGQVVELWALQRRMRPGSDYLLLARKPGPEIIMRFDVLQRACPRGQTRSARGPSGGWRTDYCAVSSRAELIRLGRRMARLPALGVLTHVDAPEPR
ncbi:hypothetical protein [Caulobacter sp. 17J65-9]|uniref:hypothetical protein n=1 Tax=Caulobacter sp. 17J65-9 TaxID=2709382 RepID=UPI0013CD3EAD|nr:hypothetical protein [Caulobacter sp. 17J65-9]NEX95267.1 hypothetical protein [Caulobacter sp. 17J65-9]